jgi:hypothetical protein
MAHPEALAKKQEARRRSKAGRVSVALFASFLSLTGCSVTIFGSSSMPTEYTLPPTCPPDSLIPGDYIISGYLGDKKEKAALYGLVVDNEEIACNTADELGAKVVALYRKHPKGYTFSTDKSINDTFDMTNHETGAYVVVSFATDTSRMLGEVTYASVSFQEHGQKDTVPDSVGFAQSPTSGWAANDIGSPDLPPVNTPTVWINPTAKDLEPEHDNLLQAVRFALKYAA